jgi:hypothetical protein
LKKTSVSPGTVVVVAESIEEAGFMHWLALRFHGQSVRMTFDTTSHLGFPEYPAMWFVAELEKKDGSVP